MTRKVKKSRVRVGASPSDSFTLVEGFEGIARHVEQEDILAFLVKKAKGNQVAWLSKLSAELRANKHRGASGHPSAMETVVAQSKAYLQTQGMQEWTRSDKRSGGKKAAKARKGTS